MDRQDVARAFWVIALFIAMATAAAGAGGEAAVPDAPPEVPRARAPLTFPLSVGTLPAGKGMAIAFQVSAPAAPVPAALDAVSNQGTVSANGVTAVATDDPDDATSNADPTLTVVSANPDLQLTKSVTAILDSLGVSTGQTALARPGDTIVYQLAWQHKSSATQVAAGVSLSDPVPADATFDAGSSAAGWSCADNAPAATSCNLALGDLAPGQSGTAAYAVTVLTSGLSGATTLDNSASISVPIEDPTPADNTSSTMTALLFEADIDIQKVVDQPMPIAGESVVFMVTATNLGPDTATAVVIADALPSGLVLTGAAASQGSFVGAVWSLGSLTLNQTETLQITATVAPAPSDPLMITNVASLSSLDQSDPVAGNNSASATLEHKQADYGDLPDPLVATAGQYPTLLANDGARHAIPNTGAVLFLGAAIDAEADGQPTATADGDDVDIALDDEDGVNIMPLVVGDPVAVEVTASAAGLLDAWIDLDADGLFAPAEQIFASQPVVAGVQTLTSATVVPVSAVGDTFARFRLSSAGGLAPAGRADDGEVEDYAVTIVDRPVLTISDASVLEGNPGDVAQLIFTLSRSANANAPSVQVATADGTASAGSDYLALGPTTVMFTAGGALSQTVVVEIFEDNTIEADETLLLNLSAATSATIGDGQGLGTIINDDFDNTPPNVDRIGVVGVGDLTTCQTVLGDASALRVTFSEPMSNAQDPLQYRLLAAGPDGDFGTLTCAGMPVGDDRAVAILAATSDADPLTPTVTLDLAGAQRSSGVHRLLVCGTLTDAAGNALDGGAGAGSDLLRDFRVDRFNRFANGHFDDCDPLDVEPVVAGGWILEPPMVVATSRQDALGSSISGSLLADLANADPASATQTVTVAGGQRYALSSHYRLQLDGGAGVRFGLGCVFFDQPGGAGLALVAVQDVIELTASTAGWVTRTTVLEAPVNAQSARCSVSVVGLAAGATPPMFQLFVDDLSLDTELFTDGFESGDTAAWSASVP